MRSFNGFCFTITVAILLTGCSRQEQAPVQVQVPAEGEEVYDSGFKAYMPGASRTSVDIATGRVLWDDDDPIMVSNGSESSTLYVKQGGGTSSELYSQDKPLSGEAFYAVYPAASASWSEGVFHSSIPVNQVYTEGGFASGVFPMVAECGADRELAFKNAASLLKIVPQTEFFAGMNIYSVSVSANESMAGDISVSYAQGGVPVVTCTGPRNVALSAFSGLEFDTPIYVVVAPGKYTGLKVSLSMSGGAKYTYTAPDTVAVDRSKYQTINFTAVDNSVDLSASQSANCYMITEPGSYKFKANVKGNGVTTSCGLPANTPATDISSVKVYYTDGETFVDGGFSYMNGYVRFSTVEGTLPVGTILLSAVNSAGTTLWSWHIWSNPDIADVELSDGSKWLNMNLGAHQVAFNSAGFNGYYYQWGRKDPIQQEFTPNGTSEMIHSPFVSHASLIDGSLENSMKNPTYFYGGYKITIDGTQYNIPDWCTFDDDVKYYDWWNKNITSDGPDAEPGKTMFDPCPPGYHVPTLNEIQALCTLGKAAGTQGAIVDGKLFFPYASSRAAGITVKHWGGTAESDTDNTVGERGFYHCTNPYNTGNNQTRTVYRLWARKGNIGYAGSIIQRAQAMTVRCKKD